MEFERHLETLEGETRRRDFSDLKTLFLNCTLKRSPELSHTEGLVAISRTIMEKNMVAAAPATAQTTTDQDDGDLVGFPACFPFCGDDSFEDGFFLVSFDGSDFGHDLDFDHDSDFDSDSDDGDNDIDFDGSNFDGGDRDRDGGGNNRGNGNGGGNGGRN